MNREYIEKATEEYLDIVNNKDKSFKRFNPVFSSFMKLKLEKEIEIVKQARLTNSIYTRAAIMQYLGYIKKIYNYNDLSNINDSFQLPLQLSEECYDDINMISFITHNTNKASIIRNALEYSFGQGARLIRI